MVLTLMPATALAAETSDVAAAADANRTMTIGDAPQQDETDTRVSFRSDTENPTISIEPNNEGPDFTVTEHSFGGRIPGSFPKISDTYVVSPTFKEAEEEPSGRGQGDENYTITLIVGTNGSVTSVTRKVAEEDVPVEPDEVNGNTIPFPSAVQLMILGRLLSQYQL